MSDAIFPLLPGLAWNLTKSPMFNTKVMTSINGQELRASFQAAPKYSISLGYEFLRQRGGKTELEQLESFFYERRGAFDSFLLLLPDDNQFNCSFVGDGSTTTYQIYKKLFTSIVPVTNTKPFSTAVDISMWGQNTSQLMWGTASNLMWPSNSMTLSNNGVLTLATPLEAGKTLTVTGTYYYRCRFKEDEQQYTNFMAKLWEAKKIEMVASLGNKV